MTRFNLKALAAAVALSASVLLPTAAQAAFNATDISLVVFDSVSGKTYLRDLGVAANAFTTSLSSAGDANWTTFIGGVTNQAGLQWMVVGTTSGSQAEISSVANSGTPTPSLAQVNNTVTQWKGALSVLTAVAGTSYISSGTAADWTAMQLPANSGIGAAVGLGASPIETLNSFNISRTAATLGTTATGFTLSSSGLFAAAAAPVPEPGTWALFAAGLLAVGGVARRRSAV